MTSAHTPKDVSALDQRRNSTAVVVRQSGLASLDVLVPLAAASVTAGVGAVVLRLLGVI